MLDPVTYGPDIARADCGHGLERAPLPIVRVHGTPDPAVEVPDEGYDLRTIRNRGGTYAPHVPWGDRSNPSKASLPQIQVICCCHARSAGAGARRP